jgi:hypothetical protein
VADWEPLPKADQRTKFEEAEHMFHKIVKLSFWLVAALSVSLCSVALQAQEPAAPAPTTAKPMHSGITVTGCLRKGDSADEFAITGENGKTWELRSKTVKLDEHIGHTVTITGVRHLETKAEEAKEEKTETKESKEAEANGKRGREEVATGGRDSQSRSSAARPLTTSGGHQ